MNYLFKVNIDDKQESVKVPKGTRMLIRRCCKAVLHEENKTNFDNVKIVFTENKKLSKLSGQNLAQISDELFVKQTRKTDLENGERLGEVYIPLDTVMQKSKAYNNSFESEVVYLTVHALFFLLGYKDFSHLEKDALIEKEKKIIKELGVKYYTHF